MTKIDNYKVEFIEDYPDGLLNRVDISMIKDGIIYIFNKDQKKWAWLKCPCGCGLIITLCVHGNYSPKWDIEIENEMISITPSIFFHSHKCPNGGSHFFIKQGKVLWC